MAAPSVDLSDEQIDSLLAEAEARLAGKIPQTSVVPTVKPAPAAVAVTTASTAETGPEQQEKKAGTLSVRVPRSLIKSKPAVKTDAGEDWFHMPKTDLTPELKRDLQLLKMRHVIALGKQHFKKDSRRDPVPEFSQVGTLIEGATDGLSARLTRKEKKRTIAEEILSSDSIGKFKTKYNEIQERKMSGKKGYYKKLMARRRKG